MKTLGMMFIVIASGTVGFRISASLKQRCILIKKLLHAVQLLKNEICCYATPLPQIFALLAASTDGVLEALFSGVAKQMGRQPWLPPGTALEQVSEDFDEPEIKAVLLRLFQQLGKYDREAQLTGIHAAEDDLQNLLHRLEMERSLKSRTYQTLGICTGLAASVLLL